MGNHTNVLLVDAVAMLRAGLRVPLEAEEGLAVVGEAGDGETAVERVRVLSPDVVVMDIAMAGLNGADATRTGAPATWPRSANAGGGPAHQSSPVGASRRLRGARAADRPQHRG